jgi:hypothetical protein
MPVCRALVTPGSVIPTRGGIPTFVDVTNWLNYDSVYTERYMSTPEANPDEYTTIDLDSSDRTTNGTSSEHAPDPSEPDSHRVA